MYTVLMNQTTREFIAARETEILKKIKDLREELREIRVIKNALISHDNPELSESISSMLTFQDMIVSVLNAHPKGGAEALEILDLIDKKFNKQIVRSSISPQLSRLKQKGVLQLENGIWSLTQTYKTQKESASEEADKSDPLESLFKDDLKPNEKEG